MYARDDMLKAIKHYQKLYSRFSERVRNHYSVSQTEFDVVAFLNNHPQNNTAKEICEIRMLTKSNVSVAVENLSRMGFLVCKTDEQDRRIVRLDFLPKADDLRKEIELVQEEFTNALFQGISQEEAHQLFLTLSRINQNAVNKMEEMKHAGQ